MKLIEIQIIMKIILFSFLIISTSVYAFAQDNSRDCKEAVLPFLTSFEGYSLSDKCKFSEFFYYDFAIARNSRSVHKEGVYRETWYKRNPDNSRHISGPQILKQQTDAIKAAGGELAPDSDGDVFIIVYQGKEYLILVNANIYSEDQDNYGVISIEGEATKQESNLPGTTGTVETTDINGSQSTQSQHGSVKIEGAANPAGSIELPYDSYIENDSGAVIPPTVEKFEYLTEDINYGKISTVSISANTKNIKINSLNLNAPNVVLNEISEIKGTSAIAKATFSPSANGKSMISGGYCWSTSSNPSTADNKNTRDGILFDLSPGTVYYVRAYAITDDDTTYGNEISFNSGQIFGSFYAGGLVFYNDGMGHGLVCSETDQSTFEAWGCMGGFVSGDTGIPIDRHSGYTNTNTIVATCHKTHCAARLCFNSTLNNYYNWVLPATDEMYLIYKNLYMQNLGGFNSTDFWWTSTESDRDKAYAFNFNHTDFHLVTGDKNIGLRVRPIRSF